MIGVGALIGLAGFGEAAAATGTGVASLTGEAGFGVAGAGVVSFTGEAGFGLGTGVASFIG